MEKSIIKCTKPDCDCLEIAEQKAGGQVKNYPCLASHTEFTKEKSSETEKNKLETLISELRVEEENAFGLAMQSIKDLDFNLHYGFKGKAEALSLCIQKLNSICEHINKNIKCQCDNEIKTGQTSVMCCNICGKPDEDFWNIGQEEIILCDYCGRLETEHEENCLKSPETKAQILIDSHKLYNDEQEAITHSLITVNMVKAVLPSGDLMAYYSRVRQILINRLNEYK